MQCTKYGTIKGGVCDTLHAARNGREKGSMAYLDLMLERNCFKINKGWYTLVKKPKLSIKQIIKLSPTGNYEIGMHRMHADFCDLLKQVKNRKKFRLKELKVLAKFLAKFEFGTAKKDGDGLPNVWDLMNGNVKYGYAPPHAPAIYDEKEKNGYFRRFETVSINLSKSE